MKLKDYIEKYELTTAENWLAFVESSEDELFQVVQKLVAAKDIKIAGWLIQERIKMFGYFQI
jgi:hypothetical protein